MIFSSSARWPHACTGATTDARIARVAYQRRTPFLSDMSESVKAGPDTYGELKTRLDAKRLKRNEPLAQYTTFKIGGPADLFYDATSADDLAGAQHPDRRQGISWARHSKHMEPPQVLRGRSALGRERSCNGETHTAGR